LPWMRGMNRIGKNCLPGMECIGAFGRGRFRFSRVKSRFGLRGGNFQLRKILDLPGPGYLGIFQRGIFFRPGNLRERQGNKRNVPKRGRENRAPRQTAFDPNVLEQTGGEEIFAEASPPEEFGEIAGDALVELSPAEIQLWFIGTVEFERGRRRRSLTEQVERIIGFERRHGILHYTPSNVIFGQAAADSAQ
jgi:hypothetical protein